MDEQYLKTPQYGARSYATWFQRQGIAVGRKKAATMMETLGIISTAPKPKTSSPGQAAQDLSLFAQEQDHRSTQPGVGV